MAGGMPFKMVDMARGKESLSPKSVGKITSPPYSYEHRISLDSDALGKLGLDGPGQTPQVGDRFHVMGHGEVTNVSSNQDAEGKKSTRVELQLKKLGMRKKSGLNAGSAKDAVDQGIQEANDDG